jgi:hypothetical protein
MAELPPGGEGKIEVKLNTRGRKGPLSKTVEVTTDSATTPKLTLTMKGTVDVQAAFERTWLDFGRVMPGVVKTERMRVEARDLAALRLGAVTVSNPARLKAEIVQDGAGPWLQVTLKAGEVPGSVNEQVSVATNLPDLPNLSLAIRGKVAGELDVTPDTAVLSPFVAGRPPPEITLRVTSASGKPFHLLKVEDPSGSLSGAVAPEGGAWMVRVVARKPPKTSSGILYVVTDLKDLKRLPVPWVVSDPSLSVQRKGVVPLNLAPRAK